MADLSKWELVIQNTVVQFRSVLFQLHKIWEEIGFTEDTCSKYLEQVFSHINDLFQNIILEAQLKKEVILFSVKELMQQIATLTKELGTDIETEGYEHLSLKKLEQVLSTDLHKLQYCKEQRLAHFKELLAKERVLCKVLGTQPINIKEKLPTEEELDNFKLYLEKQESEKNHLETIFKEMRRSIVKMMNDLGISPSLNFEHMVYKDCENFILSNSNMTKLRELRDQLKRQIDTAKEHMDNIKQELIALWKYLDEPEHICHSFLNSYVGYSVATINAWTTELDRCKEKRKQNISKYVTQVKSELVKYWDLCKFNEEQRGQFIHFNSQTYTEDLLTLLELELKRVQDFYETNKAIFELFEERDNLWTKMKQLLQCANDPDRFYNRGGQLLMEEKERKTIQKKLPKIENQLRGLIKEYENIHGNKFTVNGLSIEELLKESWEHLNEEKEANKKARKEAKHKLVKKTLNASKKAHLSSSKKTPTILNTRRHPSLSISKRKLFSPSPNNSAKHKNMSLITNGFKVRKSGKVSKKSIKTANKNGKSSDKIESSISQRTDTTYSQYKEHLEERTELCSSLLLEQLLINATKSKLRTPIKTPVRTPVKTSVKPIRKKLPMVIISTTPKFTKSQLHKSSCSPSIVQSSRLATV